MSPRTTKIRQREKGREEREKEMQSAKRQVRDHHPFENKADINTEQPQLHRRAGRSPFKATNGAGDHRGEAESNQSPSLSTARC